MKALVDWLQQQIELIAAALGILATVWGWWKFVWSKKKARDRLKNLLATGDRIAASADLEGEGYDEALKHYEKALALDAENVEIVRRIVRATRKNNEMAMPVALMEGPQRKEIDAVLERLYELNLAGDKDLFLEEAQLLYLIGKTDSAVAALRKAQALAPDDPDTIVLLGAYTRDLDLVRRALAARPENASYHHHLADVLRRRGENGAAVREYLRAAELASGTDLSSRRTHSGAMQDMLSLFKERGGKIDLPAEERVSALEALAASRVSMDRAQQGLLADLYAELGRLDKANDALREFLTGDKTLWRHYLPQLKLYVSVLERGGFDPAALSAAREVLQKASDAQRYDDLLEIGEGPQHRKVGLRIDKTAGSAGVLVERSYSGYPFAKAGVRDGDRIVEFAHRKIGSLRDIWTRLIQFAPGSDVPIKVQRADELLDLTVIVQ